MSLRPSSANQGGLKRASEVIAMAQAAGLVRLDRETLAPSNAGLVRWAADICTKNNRPVASWQVARRILGRRMSVDAKKGQAL